MRLKYDTVHEMCRSQASGLHVRKPFISAGVLRTVISPISSSHVRQNLMLTLKKQLTVTFVQVSLGVLGAEE